MDYSKLTYGLIIVRYPFLGVDASSSLARAPKNNNKVLLLFEYIIIYIYIFKYFLHLWTFKTPTLTLKKTQKCKINIDGLTFSSSLWLVKK